MECFFVYSFYLVLFGRMIAESYKKRLIELQEMKSSLTVFKSKIKFTYEPIPEIFQEIADQEKETTRNIFLNAIEEMKTQTASISWEKAIEKTPTHLKEEDKQVLKNLSKMLGETDSDGQISQIEVTQNFLEKQLKEAEDEKQKNEKMYQKLGSIIGLAIVVLLI